MGFNDLNKIRGRTTTIVSSTLPRTNPCYYLMQYLFQFRGFVGLNNYTLKAVFLSLNTDIYIILYNSPPVFRQLAKKDIPED